MAKMVLGVFSDQNDAGKVVDRLQEMGFNPKDISIIMKDTAATTADVSPTTGDRVAEGTVSGATTGTLIGALAGLLVGVGAVTIPGFGAVLIGGPIASALGLTGAAATTVSAALTGALAGGVVGALTNLGVPRDQAVIYEEEIKRGAVLIAVPATGDNSDEITGIMRQHNVNQVSTVDSR